MITSMDFISMREVHVREQKTCRFKMQTDIIIRTRPDIRIMLVICRLFWRITEMHG